MLPMCSKIEEIPGLGNQRLRLERADITVAPGLKLLKPARRPEDRGQEQPAKTTIVRRAATTVELACRIVGIGAEANC